MKKLEGKIALELPPSFSLRKATYRLFVLDYVFDYVGSSFSTGADGNFATQPTLANILLQYNPR